MRRPLLLLPALLLALVVSACASGARRPGAGPVIERGIASWYGPGFHGKHTASGERYDMNALTAAHKTLPFGTLVEVRNLATGETVRVRINDRGPFVRGRVIDLSRAAARAAGVWGPGTAPVELLAVGRVPIGPRAFAVQVGAFQEEARAQQLAETLCRDYPQVAVRAGEAWHRVQVGAFAARSAAEALADELAALGYPAVVVPLPLDQLPGG
ncbi:MAG: septal ring lytic transglycosylase RlpA family protein [Rhodocyclaceae bacterium]|nr:septal ring lytic transglycosylase RlpA family protein [Rhodocyclaceae bacterium]